MSQRIDAAPVVMESFPHLVVAGPLPDAAYRRLLDDWPPVANRRIARKFAPYGHFKYEPFLGKAWKESTNAMPHIVGEAQLAYYTGAFNLAPHVDHPKLVTNSFLYCSDRVEDEPELGTVIYGGRGFSAPDNSLRLTPDLVERLL